jgi:hypothetical protein
MTFRAIVRASSAVATAIALAGCASSTDTQTVSDKGMLGHGTEITAVSGTIYRIGVTLGMNASTEQARDQALLKASELTLSKGYTHFEIVGGDGFRKVPRKVQAGPVPLSLYSEPEGSIQIKLLNAAQASADAFDAAAEKARINAAAVMN